ncbi:MAG: Rnf-Nqr domain containing protein, partial [Oscillospiraceae bacterium]
LDKALGIFLPLIVFNCIILGRAELFACKNGVIDSGLDGLGMGLGFTLALLVMGSIREVFGAGTWFGIAIPVLINYHVPIICLAPGGFFIFGCLIAAVNKFSNGKAIKKKSFSCEGCPNCSACSGTCENKEAAK